MKKTKSIPISLLVFVVILAIYLLSMNFKGMADQQQATIVPKEENDTSVIQYLITSLGNTDPITKREAIFAVGETKDRSVVELLISILLNKKEEYNVRKAVPTALRDIGDTRAVKPLISVFQNKNENWDFRIEACSALGYLGDTRAVEPLIVALTDEDSRIRWEAINSLGQIGDARAIKPLIPLLKDKSYPYGSGWEGHEEGEVSSVSESTIEALSRIGRPAIKPLIAALKDTESIVRAGAAIALEWIYEKFSDTRVIEPLIAALKDKSPQVRMDVARSLLLTGNVYAEQVVKDFLKKERNESVRKYIQEIFYLNEHQNGESYEDYLKRVKEKP